MCGTSWASYCTVTAPLRPGIETDLSATGDDEIITLAVRLPAVAVSVPIAVPSGGMYTTWSPDVPESVPPLTVHATSAVLPTSRAVKSVGPVIETVPDVPDGVMVRDGGAPPL